MSSPVVPVSAPGLTLFSFPSAHTHGTVPTPVHPFPCLDTRAARAAPGWVVDPGRE